jgi:hypothetical protein
MKALLTALICLTLFGSASVEAQKRSTSHGQKVPRPLATANFGNVGGFTEGRGVLVRWEMAVEAGVVGYYVYEVGRGRDRLASPSIVMGPGPRLASFPQSGSLYQFFDALGQVDSLYSIEALLLDGRRIRSDVVASSYIPSLKTIAGRSATDLENQSARGNPKPVENKLAVPAALQIEMAAHALVPDPAKHTWVISQPGVVRIGVRTEGLYRVPVSSLTSAGFNGSSDPAFWQLYLQGVEQPLIIGPSASYIEFYGRGVDTQETDTNAYFLVVGPEPGKRIAEQTVRPNSSTVLAPSYATVQYNRERTRYVSDVVNGDGYNYFGRGVSSTPTTFTFNLSGVDPNQATASVEVRFQGYSLDTHLMQLSLNGHTLDPIPGFQRFPFSQTYEVPISFLLEGSNSLQMASGGPAGDFSFFDYIKVSFDRYHLASQNQLNFFTQTDKRARLRGFSSANIRVFDITYDSLPIQATNLQIEANGPTFEVTVPAGRARVFYAVEDSGLLTPAFVQANDPFIISDPADTSELIVIAYKDFMPAADGFADHRRSQGTSVKVVNVQDIYDEYNYGVFSSDAIKAYLQYAYTSWAQQPKYVLRIGDASFDSRNYQGLGFFNFVPTRIVNTEHMETGSDESMADFNNDGLAEIAIGRVPSRTLANANNYLNRVMTYESGLTASVLQDRGALFAYDFPDGYDFEGMSNRLRMQLPAGTPTTMVFRGEPNAQANLVAGINTGKYVVNYSGHGTTGAWAASSFFGNSTTGQLTNANKSIFAMLTCLNGYFLNLENKSLSETLIDAANGGAIISWASSGLTTADIQELMATRFFLKLGEGNIQRMGDLVRDAKTVVPGSSDVRFSWALVGDPMLKVRPDPPVRGSR